MFRSLSTCPLLESLLFRYTPTSNRYRIVEAQGPQVQTYENFVGCLARYMSSVEDTTAEPEARFLRLKDFVLILRGPAGEMLCDHFDAEPFRDLARVLGATLYSHLEQFTVVIEAVLSPSSRDELFDGPPELSPAEAKMWDTYVSAVKGALTQSPDESAARTIVELRYIR